MKIYFEMTYQLYGYTSFILGWKIADKMNGPQMSDKDIRIDM